MAILYVGLSRVSRPGTEPSPGEIETPGLPQYDSILESLVSNKVILVPLCEEIPLERGHQGGGTPPLEIVILPLLAHLA